MNIIKILKNKLLKILRFFFFIVKNKKKIEIIDKERSGKKGPVINKTGNKQYKIDENLIK